ncbi:expansin EXLX1 family cellulose-binding protein [Spirillospora sp. NPDC047279]|uniref:expansin EXLX1 family cellulose-binding protein n=1 Tax=Spirillospora sp. NPDC047279 TaxID=3155478 RepID=UPI0033F41E66
MHATPRRRPRFRWIWVAVAVVAVGAVTVGMIRLQEKACAATVAPANAVTPVTPVTPVTSVTSVTSETAGTAVHHPDWSVVMCSMGPLPATGHYVSVSAEEYGQATLCGAYLEIDGPEGAVRAQIVDRCRACAPGRLDLSERAFAEIGDPAKGVIPIRYRLVRDPRPASRLAVRVKPGSTEDWLALLVLGHGNPITRVDLHTGDGWRPLRRGLDNHWTISRQGAGPYRVRVADRHGNQAVLPRVQLSSSTVQRTTVRLYGTQRPNAGSASPPRTPATSPSTTPGCP